MFLTRIKLAGTVLAVLCVASFALAVLASGQPAANPKGEEPNQPAPAQEPAVRAKVRQTPLTIDALARHLGVVHKSFVLTFDDPPAGVSVSLDVYEDGKRVLQGEAVNSTPLAKVKQHPCTVLFSHKAETDQLAYTIVTADGTYNGAMPYPFAGPGLVYPGPVMDRQGRILVAATVPKGIGDVSRVTVDNAPKALVLQVTTK